MARPPSSRPRTARQSCRSVSMVGVLLDAEQCATPPNASTHTYTCLLRREQLVVTSGTSTMITGLLELHWGKHGIGELQHSAGVTGCSLPCPALPCRACRSWSSRPPSVGARGSWRLCCVCCTRSLSWGSWRRRRSQRSPGTCSLLAAPLPLVFCRLASLTLQQSFDFPIGSPPLACRLF